MEYLNALKREEKRCVMQMKSEIGKIQCHG